MFLAITNLYPAVLFFLTQKKEVSNASLRVCGSTAVLGTIVIIVICDFTSETRSSVIWLLCHIILNLVYYLYLKKLNLDLSNTTQIYYRNFFSIIVLFPISLYLDVLHLPGSSGWEFYGGCFLSGILGTVLQIWTFKISMNPNYLQFESLAKVLSSIIAFKLFFANIEPLVWILIVFNFLICATFLKNCEKNATSVRSGINLSIPPVHGAKTDSDLLSLV